MELAPVRFGKLSRYFLGSSLRDRRRGPTRRAIAPGGAIPPEAAAIMAAMVRMPPKPHEQMKVGKPRGKRTQNPEG